MENSTSPNSTGAELRQQLPQADSYVLALSGGADSAAVLHLLAALPRLRCVHVNHGLGDWAAQLQQAAQNLARRYGRECRIVRIAASAPGSNIEAWARDQRYSALAAELKSGEVLICAHHQGDQAETFLLAALRGSGPAGLRGMTKLRPFAAGWLARPALGFDAEVLRQIADEAGLAYVDDPSNRDTRLRRNALRSEVLPRLRQQVPEAVAALARSADLQAGLHANLAWLLDQQLSQFTTPVPDSLALDALLAVPDTLLQPLLRRWCHRAQAPAPPAKIFSQFSRQFLAVSDAQPRLSWQGWSLRRYRRSVHLLPPLPLPPEGFSVPAHEERAWPSGGRIRLRAGQGGEVIAAGTATDLVAPSGRSLNIKEGFQSAGVPPWVRQHWPRLRRANRIVALANWPGLGAEDVLEFQWLAPPAWARYWVEQGQGAAFPLKSGDT